MRRLLFAATLLFPLMFVAGGPVASAAVSHSKSPRPPESGHWVLNNNEDEPGVHENSGGSFTVTKGKHRGVKKLTAVIGPDAESACGTGTVRVVGKHSIHEIKGETISGSSFKLWIVGKTDVGGDPPYTPDKVQLKRGGKTFTGGLEMNFAGPKGGTKKKPSIGTISYAGPKSLGGSCSLNFGFNKK